MKLLTAAPADGGSPLFDFFDALDEKQRQKLLSLFSMLLQAPAMPAWSSPANWPGNSPAGSSPSRCSAGPALTW